jgi:hypothetical protein
VSGVDVGRVLLVGGLEAFMLDLRRIGWIQIFQRAGVVGVAGAAVAVGMDLLYLGIFSKLKFNEIFEIVREVTMLIVCPIAGMLDGADPQGGFNLSAHTSYWVWNAAFYLLVSLAPLTFLRFFPQTNKTLSIYLILGWVLALILVVFAEGPTAIYIMVVFPWTLAIGLWGHWHATREQSRP